MSSPTSEGQDAYSNMSRDEMHSALFANMVVQQTNMAMMFLGKVAHPETGQFIQDFDTARMFIDQLEMLAAKTKGNLAKPEEALLKRALSTLQMAFVEVIDAPAEAAPQVSGEKAPTPEAKNPAPAAVTPTPTPAPAAEPAAPAPDDSRKKFSKKY